MRKIFLCALAQGLTVFLLAQTSNEASVINKLRDEEQKSSQVMDIAFHLTDISGQD